MAAQQDARLALVAAVGEEIVSFMLRLQRSESCAHLSPDGTDSLGFDGEVMGRQVFVQVFADGMFVAADGFDLDEVAVEVEEGRGFTVCFLVVVEWSLPIDGGREDARISR